MEDEVRTTKFLENGISGNYVFPNRAAGELAENPTSQEQG
jgi:hypothetical protein